MINTKMMNIANDSTFPFNFLPNLIKRKCLWYKRKMFFFWRHAAKSFFFTHLLCILWNIYNTQPKCTRTNAVKKTHFPSDILNNLFYDGWKFILLLTHFCLTKSKSRERKKNAERRWGNGRSIYKKWLKRKFCCQVYKCVHQPVDDKNSHPLIIHHQSYKCMRGFTFYNQCGKIYLNFLIYTLF